MWIVKNRKLFYTFSIILIVVAIGSISIWGLKLGIDFAGGTIVDVSYPNGRPDQSVLQEGLSKIDSGVSVRPSDRGENQGYIVRMKAISQEEKVTIMNVLSQNGSLVMKENTFDSIGPLLGKEAIRKAMASIIFVIIGIVLYITFAFRKVSAPVSSWKYGLIAIVALVHDVIIPTGFFAIMGHFAGTEVDTLFVTALLVILGFSVHDTIVVFDRVRENLRHAPAKKPFEEVVGESVNQTFTRSVNTSLTTLFALIILYFIGGETTQNFSLVLIIGIIAGTYSSIFVGSTLLVTIERWGKNKVVGAR